MLRTALSQNDCHVKCSASALFFWKLSNQPVLETSNNFLLYPSASIGSLREVLGRMAAAAADVSQMDQTDLERLPGAVRAHERTTRNEVKDWMGVNPILTWEDAYEHVIMTKI